jgi:hypothetical protein
VDFANCVILSPEVQDVQNVPHYVLLELTLVPAFARQVKQDVPMLLNLPLLLLPDPLQLLKMLPINSLLILANTLPVSIVMNLVGFVICVVVLDLQILLNVQLFVLVENKNVKNLAKLVKNNA